MFNECFFCFVFRTSDKSPEKVEIAPVKPVSATMKPITSTKAAAAATTTTTAAATTTNTSIAVKRKADNPTASHAKRAKKDGSTSGEYLGYSMLGSTVYLLLVRRRVEQRPQRYRQPALVP